MDDKRLSEIEARVTRAYGDYWQGGYADFGSIGQAVNWFGECAEMSNDGAQVVRMWYVVANDGKLVAVIGNGPNGEERTDFVSTARTDIPDLLTYVHQLRARIAALEAALEPADFDL